VAEEAENQMLYLLQLPNAEIRDIAIKQFNFMHGYEEGLTPRVMFVCAAAIKKKRKLRPC